MNFSQFLVESLDVEKLKHLEHVEDHIIHGAHEGVSHAADTLNDVYAFLSGKKTDTKITTKYDGAPSVVFGVNPENGKFFVGTKSVFNESPKINYTDEDIEHNHGHAPGLVAKLKLALKELPKIMPKKGGVYQGDLMFDRDDVRDEGNQFSFTPNTITYSADKNSEHGIKIANSKLGIVVHTQYLGKRGKHSKLSDLSADFDVNQKSFQNNKDVFRVNPEVDGGKISSIEKNEFKKHLEDALNEYKGQDIDIHEVLDGHDLLLKTYINSTVRDKSKPSAAGYTKFLETRFEKELAKLKTEKARNAKKEQMDTVLSHVKSHKKQFDSILKMHSSIQKAKDTLTRALSNTAVTGFQTTIGGKPTKPEGFVAIKNGRPSKLVDRAEFSAANFEGGAFQKASKEEQAVAEPTNPIIASFGRMNPPTYQGHGSVVGKVKELADERKAKHEIVLTKTQDPEKNPLSPEQKLKHARRMFPGTSFNVTGEGVNNLVDQAKKWNEAGHDHLVLVVGSDRVESAQKVLDAYNGKEYNFKKIEVVSAGNRDADSEDEEEQTPNKKETPEEKKKREAKEASRMSATKQRGHAIGGRFKEFKKGLHPTVSDNDAKEMYDEVRKGMDIQIDQNTNGISLARYAKRQDVIGVKARREQERRAKAKEMQKASKAAAKPRKMKPLVGESFVANIIGDGGGIRGLGYVSGDPAVGGDAAADYAQTNIVNADTLDNIMNQVIKKHHKDLHTAPSAEERRAKMVAGIVDRFKTKRN